MTTVALHTHRRFSSNLPLFGHSFDQSSLAKGLFMTPIPK